MVTAVMPRLQDMVVVRTGQDMVVMVVMVMVDTVVMVTAVMPRLQDMVVFRTVQDMVVIVIVDTVVMVVLPRLHDMMLAREGEDQNTSPTEQTACADHIELSVGLSY